MIVEEGTILLRSLLKSDLGPSDLEYFLDFQEQSKNSKKKGMGTKNGKKDKLDGIRLLMKAMTTSS